MERVDGVKSSGKSIAGVWKVRCSAQPRLAVRASLITFLVSVDSSTDRYGQRTVSLRSFAGNSRLHFVS